MSQISMQSYINGLVAYHESGINQMSQIKNFNDSQAQVKEVLANYDKKQERITTLGNESTNFLRDYSSGMSRLSTQAGQLAGQNASRMVNGKSGEVTSDTVKNTVQAARSMVDEYNKNLQLVSGNARRGEGVAEQRNRMQEAPAGQNAMQLAGITQNEDGSLKLDERALTSALSSQEQGVSAAAADALGQVATGVQEDARAGINTRSGSLVANDITRMQGMQNPMQERKNAFEDMYASMRGTGAYGLNNMAATGMMMNMVA